ncbi:MAG: hypothetical protein CMK09_11420 [Ponticaulis sp.]|nr:hypothetical protein [Ponticaulis sp.]|tara:strand:- start:17460 stop:19799 length:2340 start_codon:yes stop_codon:yes gene_type:complete
MARKTLSPGTEIAQFKIREEVSEDVLGVTYLGEASDGEDNAPIVVIREYFPANLCRRRGKKIHPSRRSLQPEFSQALVNEAYKFERYVDLESDGLIQGLDLVEDHGTVYLITQKPTGESLAEIQARDGIFSPGFARTLIDVLTAGLARLEEAGLVHGLIAPDRIMRQDDGLPAIITPDHLQDFTSDSAVLRTAPANTPYVAPEMLNSRAGDVGPWSDVYSLCASFYLLLTGQEPVSGKARMAALEAGQDDPLDLDLLESQLVDDPTLFGALKNGLNLLVEDRLAGVAALNAAMVLAPVELPDEEDAVGFAAEAAPGWWEQNGRGVIAAAAVLCLLVLAIPLVLFLRNDDSGSASDAGRTQIAEVETPSPEPPQAAGETDEADTEPEPVADETPATEETPQPGENDALSSSVTAWLAVDQDDPDAILSFLRDPELEGDVRRQAEARWRTLEAEGWREAQESDSAEAVEDFMAIYGDTPPVMAVHYEDAQGLLETLEAKAPAEAEPEFIETTTDTDDTLVEAPAEDTIDAPDADAETPQPVPSSEPEPEPEPEQPDTFQDCPECPVLTVASIAGEDIAIAVRETTIAEYGHFLDATGRATSNGCFVHRTASTSLWAYDSSANFRAPGYPVSANHPAVCVSYGEADAFASWLSAQTGKTYRLPTEAEWRVLAGAMPSAANACAGGNFADSRLTALGVQLQAASCSDGNAFASAASADTDQLRNVYGNVEEWVTDCDRGDCARRLALGGSWASVAGQFGNGLRGIYTPSSRTSTLGFRLVREN